MRLRTLIALGAVGFCALRANSAGAVDSDVSIDRWSSMASLSAEPDLFRLVEEPIVIEEGPLRLTITDGVLVPIFSGKFAGEWSRDGEQFLKQQRASGRPGRVPSASERGSKALVGFVLVDAEATAQVTLNDRADAQVLANRMVLLGVDEASAWTAVASGAAPLKVDVEAGVFVSLDPRLTTAFLGAPGGQADGEDVFSVVVYGERKGLNAALDRAKSLFSRRMKVYEKLQMEVPEGIGVERLAERAWPDSSRKLFVADLLTDQRFGGLSSAKRSVGDRDRWLALLRDDQGVWDARRQWSLRSMGIAAAGYPVSAKIGGVPLPPQRAGDPTSAPRASVGVVPTRADARVTVVPREDGQLDVEVVADLTVTAKGGPIRSMQVSIPSTEAIANSWELQSITLADGSNIVGSSPVLDRRGLIERDRDNETDGDQADEDDDRSPIADEPPPPVRPGPNDRSVDVWVFFPEPVEPGASITFQVHYKDTWNLRNWGACLGERPMGDSSGMRSVLPSLPAHGVGTAWPMSMRVAVPATSDLQMAVSGTTIESTEDKGWRVQTAESKGTALWPSVSVGRWHSRVDPSVDGLPSVRAHLYSSHPARLASVGQQVRQMALYYRGWLPNYPVDELDVFESPAACGGFVWIAPHGMVQLQAMVVADGPLVGQPRLTDKYFEEGVLAHEVAHQYWGHLVSPASLEDFWIAETLSEGFACMYLGKAAGPKVCEKHMKEYRRTWEKEVPSVIPPRASLTDAYYSGLQPQIVYNYGPYVTHQMLRRKVGNEAFFKALDGVARVGGPVTTERLQSVLEITSEQELDEFFDYWVHNGYIPDVTLRWWVSGGSLMGEVTSNVPFGTFEVPVVLEVGEARAVVWVKVKDGKGAFRGKALPKGGKILLDPDHHILARSRRVVKGKAK
ncbi:MAG: M1 family aminopeptidase [Myxococcota bacterium]